MSTVDAKLHLILKGIVDLNSKIDVTNQNMEHVRAIIKDLKNENVILKQRLENIENKLDYLKNQSRENKLILYGIKEDETEHCNATEEKNF